MRTIPVAESLEIEFKSDLKGYSDHDLIEEIVGMTNIPSQAYAVIKQLRKEGKLELFCGGKYSKYKVVE